MNDLLKRAIDNVEAGSYKSTGLAIDDASAALAPPPPMETPAPETVQPYTRAALTARIMADHGGEPKPKPGYGRKW